MTKIENVASNIENRALAKLIREEIQLIYSQQSEATIGGAQTESRHTKTTI
jgi:hypothetical protein